MILMVGFGLLNGAARWLSWLVFHFERERGEGNGMCQRRCADEDTHMACGDFFCEKCCLFTEALPI